MNPHHDASTTYRCSRSRFQRDLERWGGGAACDSAEHRARWTWQFPYGEAEARQIAEERFGGRADVAARWGDWIASEQAQRVTIDGERRFARSFAGNLARFAPELAEAPKVGGDDATQPTPAFDLAAHAREVVAAARRGEAAPSMRHRVEHRLIVRPGAVAAGERVDCWLPFPHESARQRAIRLVEASHPAAGSAGDAVHRCVHLRGAGPADPGAPLEFAIRYEFETSALAPPDASGLRRPDGVVAPQLTDAERARYLDLNEGAFAAPADLVAFARSLAGPIARREISGGAGSAGKPATAGGGAEADLPPAFGAARRFYRWIRRETRYIAEVEYGMLRSLAAKGWETRQGDCGILAALFVALCRAAGIPARWQSGWFLKPVGGNMHDWTEFWVDGLGWLPCDPTYGPIVDDSNEAVASGSSNDPATRDFFCGGIDAYRMVANVGVAGTLSRLVDSSNEVPESHAALLTHADLKDNATSGPAPGSDPAVSEPFDDAGAKRHWRSEPFDFQRGEVETATRNLFFPDWSHAVSWTSEPVS